MTTKIKPTLSIAIGMFLLFASSCKKDDNSPSNATNGKTMAVFNSNLTYETLTDVDGNEYKTIKIGTQTWMAENLRTFKYNDGTSIPNVTDKTVWINLTSGAYCTYGNTSKNDSIATFGCLYNWYAVNTSKLAPKGWHVPTDLEWTTLIDYLGGASDAEGKLKEIGATHWTIPNTDATNETGFTALPGGYRSGSNTFGNIGDYCSCWSATEASATYAWRRSIHDYGTVIRTSVSKDEGLSIRCVKD